MTCEPDCTMRNVGNDDAEWRIEVAPTWRKSSHGGNEGGECVEIAHCSHDAVHVRDSKLPATAPTFTVAPPAWAAFLAHAATP